MTRTSWGGRTGTAVVAGAEVVGRAVVGGEVVAVVAVGSLEAATVLVVDPEVDAPASASGFPERR
jgi:hypothetical protein